MKKRLVGCALLFLLLALFLAGCGNGDGGTAERTRNDPGTGPEGLSEIVFLSAYQEPAEGDDPAALSVPDNLFRVSWRLKTCDNYSMDSYSQITAKVAFITYNQEAWTMKDYRAGAMVQIDIAKSPFVSNAWQTCFANGEALMRGPASGKAKDWDGRNTVWDEGEPTRIERDEYFAEYGLFGTELSNYLLNEETVAAWDDLTDHGDGT